MFRHAVYDNLFDAALVHAASLTWPAADWPGWHAVYQSAEQKKRACNRWEDLPEACKALLRKMLYLDVSAFGLGKLAPDTALWGSGMQDMGSGDVLARHLDADTHRQSGLQRRLNAILFLSSLGEQWGGQLELYDASGTIPAVVITPLAGRLVLFACGDDTWHAVRRLTCPPDARRKTLACWWYGPADHAPKRLQAHFAA